MNTIKTYASYITIAILAFFAGAVIFKSGSDPDIVHDHSGESPLETVYTCSMHPQIRQDEPGNCPICGMELIPAESSASETDPNALVMTEAAMKLAEIETSPVISTVPERTFTFPGKITVDQSEVSSVTALFSGRIEELYVDFIGAYVKEDQMIASVYSPELIAAQQELIESTKSKDQYPELYKAAVQKLRFWLIPDQTIRKIEQSGTVETTLDIVSPVSGFVTELYIDRQDRLKTGDRLFTITNLSKVWAVFDVYESDISMVKAGQYIDFSATSLPGKNFRGTISYIDPVLQHSTRTVQIRVDLNNPDLVLKPGMLIEGDLVTRGSEEQLVIPESAVMWTGKRSIVFVRKKDSTAPSFSAREILLGDRVDEGFVVLAGLSEDEEVVTNGTFKLDSAAQLADKLSMMNKRTEDTDEPTVQEAVVPESFKAQLKQMIRSYMDLKNDLVNSDMEQAGIAVENVLSRLNEVESDPLDEDMLNKWIESLENLRKSSLSIKQAETIESQRTHFISLSDEIIELVKYFRIDGVYYHQFCPMADNGNGAFWLSEKEPIENPYFGEMMLNCGETISRINF